jgi:hypothetical protein
MADVSLSDLGSSSSPLAGLDASDYAGYGSGGNASSPTDLMSGSGMAGAGMLGAGALGFGALMMQGPGQLPAQYGQMEARVPGMQAEASSLEAGGASMTAQGQQALGMAQRGELTPEQQAQLKQYSGGLTNQARQQYANMGRNPDQDTSFLSASADIDSKVNAMAQQQIQTTIQLGLGEISAGSSMTGQGLGFENASNQALIAAGQAQLQMDKSYSDSLTSAFSSIAGMFAKAAPLLLA